MSLELVTGYHGEPHVTASQIASFNRAAISNADKVFANGDAFFAEMIDANTIRIHGGDMVLQGRHITQPSTEYVDLQVDSGATGRYRKDLAVIEYTRDSSTGVESVEFKILKGTTATTAATAIEPAVTVADIETNYMTQFALWAIPINELSVGALVRKFEVKTLYDEIYPVGSIYLSVNNVNPSTLFGGTWERWGDGKCILGAGTLASEVTGGTEINQYGGETGRTTITMTKTSGSVANIKANTLADRLNAIWEAIHDLGGPSRSAMSFNNISFIQDVALDNGNHSHSFEGHLNNMSPYITCYMWKRTA